MVSVPARWTAKPASALSGTSNLGICYLASGFTRLGQTVGCARSGGRHVHQGQAKARYNRPLRDAATRLLRCRRLVGLTIAIRPELFVLPVALTAALSQRLCGVRSHCGSTIISTTNDDVAVHG